MFCFGFSFLHLLINENCTNSSIGADRSTHEPCKNYMISCPERSEPSSRAFLIGEQPNPWDLCCLLSCVTASIRLFHHHFFLCHQRGNRCKPCDTAPKRAYLIHPIHCMSMESVVRGNTCLDHCCIISTSTFRPDIIF